MAQITLTLNDSSGRAVAQYNLDTAGSALHIPAENGVNYQFTDLATGLGPQNITTAQQGSDLLVSFDSGTDLVIENYFTQGQGALVGINADGGLTSYPVSAAPEHALASEVAAGQTLGSDQPPLAPLAVVGGIGLIAGGIALASGKSGKSYKEPAPAPDNHDNTPAPNPSPNPAPNNPSPSPAPSPSPNPSPAPNPNPSPLPPGNQTPNPSPVPPGNPVPPPLPPGPSPQPNPTPTPNPNPNQPKPGNTPIAKDDKESASPGDTVTIDVLKNDTDPDGVPNIDVHSVRLLDAAGKATTILKVPGEGEWNVTFNGHVIFKPEPGFKGNPTPVQYTISDQEGHTSQPAKITLTYDPNQQPNSDGVVTLDGEAKIGGTLKAVVADNDGVQTSTVKYQWFADGDAISGATGATYTLTAADRGKHISVYANYTDGQGHNEAHTSAATGSIGDTVAPSLPQPTPNPTPIPQPNPNPAPNPLNPSPQMPGHPGIPDPNLKAYQPVLYDDTVKVKQRGGAITINVVENDTDAQRDIDPNTVKLLDKDKNAVTRLVVEKQGVWTVSRGGNVTFTPDKEFKDGDPDPVEYILNDRNGNPSYNRAKITINYPDAANNQEGKVELIGATKIGQTLLAKVEDADGVQPQNIKYQWFADGDAISGATGASYTIQPGDKNKTLTVHVEYKDDLGHDEAFSSAPTAQIGDAQTNVPPVSPFNHTPTGKVTITGEAKVGETLTASNDIKDDDGLGTITYRWFAGGQEVGQGERYTVQPGDKNKTITVKAEYSDGRQNAESVSSDATVAVEDAATPTPQPQPPGNNQPGSVTIAGEAKVGETLTATAHDADGVPANVNYGWFAGSTPLGTGATYTVKPADKGKTITVKAIYTDGAGHAEVVSSDPTAEVSDAAPTPQPPQPPATNHEPVGSVTITGDAKVGETLTASNDLKDDDGMGQITYRWFADGKEIGQGASYTLTDADKGKTITVKAEYTDGKGTAESVESAKTAEVAENTAPTPQPPQPPTPQPTNHPGTITITGDAKVGGTLTAEVKDDDQYDAAKVQYQWLRDGKPIDGATASSYTLAADDAGHKISVQATYDDNAAHHESPTSAASDIGAQNNADQPTVSISGSDSVNEGGAATYTVTLDKASDQPVTLTLTLKHGETTDADFAPQPIEKTLTIPAGQTSATFKINTSDDRLPENDEKYSVEISAPQGAKLDAAKSSVTTQIVDNDENADNHHGTNTDTTFAGDRNADVPYFVQSIDSGFTGNGHLIGHQPGKGLNVTYAFATSPVDKDEPGKAMSGFDTYSETQKAAIRTVLDHIAEHVNVKFNEGNNATLNFYKHTMDTAETVGYGIYGGGVHLSAERFTADDAFRSDIPYRITGGDAIEYYGWHAALHEVGHTLGMDHPFDHAKKGDGKPDLSVAENRDTLSVMSYVDGETIPLKAGSNYYPEFPIAQNKLGIYDLAALHHSFGVNPNYHSGDDTYGFKEFNKDAIGNDIYIHDGGGLDTFDAHEQTLDLNIDLTPGSWIYAGEKTAHLALNDDLTPTHGQMFIGYGTQIENAKGGTGNDIIKGNSAANYLFGFDGDDHLDGGAGNDQLEGGRGADTLTGGKGADTFIFASPLDGKADTILDFNFNEGDVLQLDHNIFTALQSGTLAADQFVLGKAAQDANDHLIYDRATGEFAYDPDGSGAAAAVTIARLSANHDLENTNIHII